MKKRVWILVVALCAVAFAGGVFAKTRIEKIEAELRPDFTVVIDGEKRVFKNVNGEEVYPILYQGTTYLPLRAIAELMGREVYWYEDDKKVELKKATTVTDADVIIAARTKEERAQKETQEKIGVEKAKEIALEKAGFAYDDVIFERTELDRDDGVMRYEIEFRHDGMEYEYEIHAETGAVLKKEYDRD